MNANIKSFKDFLEGERQIHIPIYQRGYSWEKYDWQQTLDDVVRAGKRTDERKHFMGAIICSEEEEVPDGSMKMYTIIDGQQRLTTMSLLVDAWCKTCGTSHNSHDRIWDAYLHNRHGDVATKYKLCLTDTNNDRISYDYLLDDKKNDLPRKKRSKSIMSAHEFFMRELKDADLDVILKGIHRMQVALIEVDGSKNSNEMQEIFESLNSTGKKLSETDLIKNFVLMKVRGDEQKRRFNEYWKNTADVFKDKPSRFDYFMYYFLLLKTQDPDSAIMSMKNIYREFKVYAKDLKMEDILSELSRYAGYYKDIRDHDFGSMPGDARLNKAAKDLGNFDLGTMYPLLFKLLNDHDGEKLSTDDLVRIMGIIESYLFRRSVCGQSNPQRRRFIQITCDIDKNEEYVANLSKILGKKHPKRDIFPRDADFCRDFEVIDAYKSPLTRYILDKIESHKNHNVPDDELTIEHIMPQKIEKSELWKKALGDNWMELHEKWVGTMGNLTLIDKPTNSIMKNEPFDVKKPHYADSNLKLNKRIAGENTWNIDKIQNRGVELTEEAIEIWRLPFNDDGERITLEKDEEGFWRGAEDDVVETYNDLKDDIQRDFPVTETDVKSNYIGVYRNGKAKLFCSIYKRQGGIILVYPPRDDGFEADNTSFVEDMNDFASPVVMTGSGRYMSKIENMDDVKSAIEVLHRLYDNGMEDAGTGRE